MKQINKILVSNNRTSIVKKNVVFGAVVKSISILVSILLVPLTINYVNSDIYGIWLTLSSIISWLSFFDVGFGLGMRNKLTTALALGEIREGRKYVSTAYFILTIIFILVAVVGYCCCGLIDWCSLLNVSQQHHHILIISSRIVVVTFCFSLILKLIQNVYQAYQMTAAASALDTLGQVLSLGVIFILTKTTSPDLSKLALVFCLSPIIVLICASIYMFRHKFKEIAPSFKYIDKALIKDIFNLGSQFFLIQIVCVVLYQATNFIISHYCGPEQVTVYNVSYRYLSCATMIFGIIMAPLWSAFTDASAKSDSSWMSTIYKKLVRINVIIIVLLVIMVVISPVVYRVWLGNSIDMPLNISILVGIYIALLSISNLHATILNGMSKVQLQMFQSLIQVIIYIPLVVLLAKSYGIHGILLALVISACIPAVLLPIQVKRIITNKANGIFNK